MMEDYGYQSPGFDASTISPQRHRGMGYTTDDQTTNDVSRANAYNSAAKIRLGK